MAASLASRCLLFPHWILLGDEGQAERIAAAIAKVFKNADKLR